MFLFEDDPPEPSCGSDASRSICLIQVVEDRPVHRGCDMFEVFSLQYAFTDGGISSHKFSLPLKLSEGGCERL